METVRVDVAVVGAGAGGFGAIFRLIKSKKISVLSFKII